MVANKPFDLLWDVEGLSGRLWSNPLTICSTLEPGAAVVETAPCVSIDNSRIKSCLVNWTEWVLCQYSHIWGQKYEIAEWQAAVKKL